LTLNPIEGFETTSKKIIADLLIFHNLFFKMFINARWDNQFIGLKVSHVFRLLNPAESAYPLNLNNMLKELHFCYIKIIFQYS